MSETVFGGPTGGVVCPARVIRRRPPRGVRPLTWSVEKQATPATAPPLTTQAVDMLVPMRRKACEIDTCLKARRVCD
jgi:hypothetical protein